MNILVTGHSSGIGKKILQQCLKNEHKVYGISRRLSSEIKPEFQIGADLSSFKGITEAKDWLNNKKIDVFIHCAGSNEIIELINASKENYHYSFNLHVLSATQLIIPIINNMKVCGGKIILISSIWSKIACHSRGPYSISKAGLNALAKQIALEHGSENIKANSIVLGFVETPLSNKTKFDPKLKKAKERVLTQENKLATSEEIAKAIYQIININTPYLNGSEIILDGGVLSR